MEFPFLKNFISTPSELGTRELAFEIKITQMELTKLKKKDKEGRNKAISSSLNIFANLILFCGLINLITALYHFSPAFQIESLTEFIPYFFMLCSLIQMLAVLFTFKYYIRSNYYAYYCIEKLKKKRDILISKLQERESDEHIYRFLKRYGIEDYPMSKRNNIREPIIEDCKSCKNCLYHKNDDNNNNNM